MGNPPLVFVLSEKDCSMLLFPFINDDEDDLVECVLLPEIPIWGSNRAEEGALLNRHLLGVMLLLCGGRGEGEGIDYSTYKLKYPFEGTKKSVIKQKIQTVRENMFELIQKEKEVAERKLQENEIKLQEAKRNQERMARKHAREINERERRIAILEAQAKV